VGIGILFCAVTAFGPSVWAAPAKKKPEPVKPAAPVAAPAAPKPTSFEAAAANAHRVNDLGWLLAPVFTDDNACKTTAGDDDLGLRRCEAVHEWALNDLAAGTYVAIGDDAALSILPYDATEKKLELDVSGCLACTKPIKLEDGRPRFVTTRVPKAISAQKQKVVGLDISFHDVELANPELAAEWIKKMRSRLKVEFVFKVGQRWKAGGDKGYEGVTFVRVAHRVVDKCSGKVIASDPPSQKEALGLKDASCPDEMSDAEVRAEEEAALPEQLVSKQINTVMTSVRAKVQDCFTEFADAGDNGAVTLKLVVAGSGSVSSFSILPPHDKTPVGICIRTVTKGKLTFPRFRGEKMVITYPFKPGA